MGWDGSLIPLCSLGGGWPSALLGCLADRLLIARGGAAAAPGGKVEVASHYLPLLHPLLYGWATLAASNILPGQSAACDLGALLAWSPDTPCAQLGLQQLEACTRALLHMCGHCERPSSTGSA